VAFQAIQILLAIGIVAAFASLQFGLARPDNLAYLVTNLVSSAGLTVTAVVAFQLGFVITNGLWVAVSVAGLTRLARGRSRRGG
jgi:formate-dependent nitrite reductase membrane component NrfD